MKWLLILLLILPGKLFAGVDPRQGIFYISYKDLEFPGTVADITRSYNSNNTQTGLFGYGWRSFIETKLTALPDGTLSLSWWGGGIGDYYEPAVINRKGLYNMVDAIIKDLIKNNKLENDPVAIAEKKSYYFINHKQRAEKYIGLQKTNVVTAYTPSPSSRQQWLLDVNQTISWTGKVFKVKSWRDQYEFDVNGNMIFVDDRAYNMKLDYTNGRLSRIIVNDTSICEVNMNASGQIIQLIHQGKGISKKAVFTYDSSQNLLYSKDAGDNEYWFNYDLYHNLTRIGYADSSSMNIIYDAASNRVTRLKERNNATFVYEYPYFYTEEGRINYDHYATRVKQYDSTGKLVFTQYKEFENRIRDDGSSYQHRILEQSDTLYHEVLYEPEVGNARYRKKNNKEAWAAYDSKKRPSWLHMNDSIYKSRYNINDMPEYFLAKDSIKNDSVEYKYLYDEHSQLKQVIRNDKKFILTYDSLTNTTLIQTGNDISYSIRHMEDSTVILSEKRMGSRKLSSKEWKIINDVLNAAVIEDTQSKKNNLLTSDAELTREKVTGIFDRYQRKKERGFRSMSQIADKSIWNTVSALEKETMLLGLLYDINDILVPKKIEHEWIWERM